ncbi:MAG: lipopolysaccharide assembly protein LapA domain-containing protein [Burkholderiales bacterium]|jgi:uncharacterized integral membrane protein|nr:lipopolysaccharide assembly protein LapA domain-containing protein [Burkholderiales bacterium]
MAVFRYLGMLAVALVIILLAIFNADNVTFSFFGVRTWQAPLILMLFITLVLGILLGMFFSFLKTLSAKRQHKKKAAEKNNAPQNLDVPVVSGLQNFEADSTLPESGLKTSDNPSWADADAKKTKDEPFTGTGV